MKEKIHADIAPNDLRQMQRLWTDMKNLVTEANQKLERMDAIFEKYGISNEGFLFDSAWGNADMSFAEALNRDFPQVQ
jgi:hypothetical protein